MTDSPSPAPAPPPPGADHAETTPGTLDRALALVRFLRAHSPWDARQTPRSLLPYLIEETHEVVDAVVRGDPRALEAELGDLLLNLAFQVVIGEEAGDFDADSVARALESKVARRHPHLYGGGEAEEWDAVKARERAEAEAGGAAGLLAPLATGPDPLTHAYRIQERVAGVGFDWADHRGAAAKVAEELAEVDEALAGADPEAVEEEVGDLLFAVVNLARLAGVHPVPALTRANRKFRNRFDALEQLAAREGVVVGEASLAELDALWEAVKVAQRGGQ